MGKVHSKIYSIAPRMRETSVEYESVTGIQCENLMDYVEDYINQVQTHIGVAQDELMAHLKEKVQQAQRTLKYSAGFANLKFKIRLSYTPGGTSSLGTAVLGIRKN